MNKPVFAAQGVVSVERMDGYRSRDAHVVEVTLWGMGGPVRPKKQASLPISVDAYASGGHIFFPYRVEVLLIQGQ
jgi:hypothetical protein